MVGGVWEPTRVDFRRVRSIREGIESGELRFGVRLCSRPRMVWRLVRLGPCGRCACHAGCTRLGREGPGCDGRLRAARKPERSPAEPLCGCCERWRGMWIASLWPSPNCNQPSGDPPHSGSPQWAAACVQSSAKVLTRVRRTRGRRLKRVRSGGLGSRRVSPRSPYGRNGAARGWLSSAVVTNSGRSLRRSSLVPGLASGACRTVTWLILPVVICLSQRLSHACLSINKSIL
jgi:hypothetical protein